MRFLMLFVSACFSLYALDVKLSSSSVIRGQTLLVSLKKEKNTQCKYIAFEKKHFQIFQNPKNTQRLYALVPVSYYTKEGNYYLKLHCVYKHAEKIEKIPLRVLEGHYKKESITVSKNKVNPKSQQVQKRIAKEYAQAMKIYNTVDKELYISQAFILPLHSKITSEFGKARIYNGELKGYHSGTDFRAKMKTPVHASNDGKVVLVEKRFYAGGSVVIDHGEGIYTCYFHLSKFFVKKNQWVKRGEIIALSGKSGRVTGPHLHFSARIHGIQVDALQLASLLNNTLLKD